MKRAYLHGILDLNAGKLNALNALFAPFRDALKKTMAYWHVRLQQGADLPLYVALPDKTSVGGLSARQMKSVGNMVRTQLLSWQALLELRVRHLVTDSSLTDDDKLVLLRVNKWHAWWKPEFQLPWKPDKDGVLVPCGMKVRNKVMVDVEPRLLKLARLLVKQATKSNRFPDMGRVNTLVLDRIVAKPERPDNTDHPRVSWWVKTSTLTKGKPVEVGLLANTHFEHAYEDAVARGGGMCGVVQLHRVKGTKDFSMSLVLDIPDSAQRDTGRTVGLDFGMADALLATSDGHLFGRKMLERLRVLDEQLIEHDQWLAKRSLKRKGDREHERLNRRIRETVKNEVGRIINQLALKHDPEYETLETLDAMGDFDTDPMQPWEQQTQQMINQITNGQYVDMENTRRLRNAMEGIADATAGYDDGTPELARSLASAAALGSNDRTAAQRLSEEVLADLRQSPDGKSWQYARTIAEQVHERL